MLFGFKGFCLGPLLSPSTRDCVILQSMKWRFFFFQEFLGLLLGVVLAWALMYPITSTITMLPEKLYGIVASIVLAVVTFRHAISFGTFPAIRSRALRYLWFATNVFLMLFVYNQYQTILSDLEGQSITIYMAEYGVYPDYQTEEALLAYIRSVSTLAIIGTFLGIVITNYRLIKSLFKQRNAKVVKTLYEEHL